MVLLQALTFQEVNVGLIKLTSITAYKALEMDVHFTIQHSMVWKRILF